MHPYFYHRRFSTEINQVFNTKSSTNKVMNLENERSYSLRLLRKWIILFVYKCRIALISGQLSSSLHDKTQFYLPDFITWLFRHNEEYRRCLFKLCIYNFHLCLLRQTLHFMVHSPLLKSIYFFFEVSAMVVVSP